MHSTMHKLKILDINKKKFPLFLYIQTVDEGVLILFEDEGKHIYDYSEYYFVYI